MEKNKIFIALIIGWMIFSLGYIAYDQFQGFKLKKVQQAYQAGLSDSINRLMNESEKCEAIPLYSGDKQVNLIAIDCLQKAESK